MLEHNFSPMALSGPAALHAGDRILDSLPEIAGVLLSEALHEPSLEEAASATADPKLAEIESLGQRCKDGDLKAWNSLFPIVWPVLVTFVHRLYRSFDEQDAEDVAQATLEAAISGIGDFSGRGLFRGWLFGIASRQATTWFRRRGAKKRGLELLLPLEDSTDHPDHRAKSPADSLEAHDRAAILHRAMEELDELDRDLIHLHFFGELTFKEIGEARQMNPKTVYTRLTKSKSKLLALVTRANLTSANG